MTTNETSKYIAPDSVRTYLDAALEHLLAAGRSTHDFVEFALDKFGINIVPHLKELQEDIREGRTHIAHLAESSKAAVFGIHVTEEQRQRMIAEAAYLRAAARGFAGGGDLGDWYEAEREIDALLGKQAGLLDKGRKTAASVASTAEQEFAHFKETVTSWIESHAQGRKKGV